MTNLDGPQSGSSTGTKAGSGSKTVSWIAILLSALALLERLIGLLGPSNLELLKQTSVITISDRIANQCTKAGIRHVVVSDSPADDSVLEKLQSLVPH